MTEWRPLDSYYIWCWESESIKKTLYTLQIPLQVNFAVWLPDYMYDIEKWNVNNYVIEKKEC